VFLEMGKEGLGKGRVGRTSCFVKLTHLKAAITTIILW
jgi:hypothetical protein